MHISWNKGHYYTRHWHSLLHVWNEWYHEYVFDAKFPRLIVRFEDLLFHTPAVVEQIRQCVGATYRDSSSSSHDGDSHNSSTSTAASPVQHKFKYVTESVKDGTQYFDHYKRQSGIIFGDDPVRSG